jgi:hypothetical protein
MQCIEVLDREASMRLISCSTVESSGEFGDLDWGRCGYSTYGVTWDSAL